MADSRPDTAEREAALEFNRLLEQSSFGAKGARLLRGSPEPITPDPAVPTRLPPELADRFRLVRQLSSGGESDIFVVIDAAGRELVLKLYRAGIAPSPDTWLVLHAIDSPHVARLLDWGDADGEAFEVMEYVGTAALSDLIKNGSRDELRTDTITEIVRQITAGLNALHAARVIHRDLKPANILVRSWSPLELVLADFGLSRYLERTTTFSAAGHTLAYTAPETFAGHVSAARDWWSLGMIVREMATGESPFQGLSTEVVMLTLASRPIDCLQITDPRLRLLCRGLLLRDPATRWGAAEVARWLAGESPDVDQDLVAQPSHQKVLGDTGWHGQCPYRGLAPYEVDDADVFFGRAQLTASLLAAVTDRLGRDGLMIVIGASGAGKSSLLRAGLLAGMARGGLGQGSQGWPRALMTPGRAPLDELAVCLAPLIGAPTALLRQLLGANPDEVGNLLRLAVQAGNTSQGNRQNPAIADRAILVIDQFEQVFTLAEETERANFLEALECLTAADHDTGRPPAMAILGVRADFYSDCLRYAPLARALQTSPFVVTPMTEADIRIAIVAPAERVGLAFEPGLVDVIMADVGSVSGRPELGAGVLPFLSQAMLATWQHRTGNALTHEAYRAGGGVAHGIEHNAEVTYSNLKPDQQRAMRRLLLRMITVDTDGRATRRALGRDEVIPPEADHDMSAAWNELTRARLVVVQEDTAAIVHDALLDAWPRLKDWLTEDRTRIQLLGQLSQSSKAWLEHGRDAGYLYRGVRLASTLASLEDKRDLITTDLEFLDASRRLQRRQSRRVRSLIAILATLLLSALLMTGVAVNQAATARAQHAIALSREVTAESQVISDPTLSALLAEAAWRIAPTNQAASNLISAYTRINVTTLIGQASPVTSLSFSPNGTILAVTDMADAVRLWNVESKATSPIRLIALHGIGFLTQAVYNPQGSILATADSVGTVRLTNVETGRAVGRPLLVGMGLTHVAFSPDGKLLATATQGGPVKLWNAAAERLIATLPGSASSSYLTFSGNGKLLAAVTSAGTVQLWRIPTGTLVTTLRTGSNGADTAAFSPDGQTLAVAEPNATVKLWNVTTGRLTGGLQTSGGSTTVAFSPNGTILATASTSGTVRLWDTTTQQQIGAPLTANGISDAAFSPDGHTLATAGVGTNSNIQLWTLPTTTSAAQLSRAICAKVGHGLTAFQWAQYVPGAPYQSSCPS